ncbi:putative signal peptide peptidase SppA [Posidoniimonas corsicana]|uniref:Putative signal peptide peptidase SppA n=1 Tax=Posidoniimonas corsicana TaxID=1938618 RepID=A0A5C5V9Q5_9BACT|nr:S49 family peptidase [Posidoniimonas corsicana]TWT35324.1 putative signal peptide peptidase SppA [Posidoniimonas corsicana]
MPDAAQELAATQQALARFNRDVLCVEHDALVKHVTNAALLGFSFEGPDELRVEQRNGVATFHVEGVMVPEAEWPGEVGTAELAAALRAAAADEQIQIGVLLLNSPGGTVAGHADLMAAAREFAAAKPLTAHADGLCCSAAYWLATTAEKLTASAGSIIGSIGVYARLDDSSKLYEKLGVEPVEITTGPLKGIGYPGLPVTAEQRAHLRERVEFIFAAFRGDVAAFRGLSGAALAEVANGGSWYAEQALAARLHDGVQSKSTNPAGNDSATLSSPEEPAMADQATPQAAEPKPASTAELKKTFPKSTAEWREEQTEAGATMADAAVAYAQFQEEQAEQARQERDEAKAEAEKAAEQAQQPAQKTEPAKSGRGASLPKGSPGEAADADTPTDFRAVARTLAKEKGITYREACRRVQREHGEEARRQFIRGVLPG